MTEIVFIIEVDPDGGFNARALGESIITQADTMQEVRANIRDAVICHFDDENTRPKVIRLHTIHDEVIAL